MKLKKLEVNSFGGISPDSPVIIDFTQSKWVDITGDNGTNKTSLLNSLLVACGQLSKDNKDFINLNSGKIDINLSFVGKDNGNYEVRVTKSSFKLMYDGVAQPEPIAKLKELLGVIGVTPMSIKSASLKDQVKWLSSYSNRNAEEFENQLKKLKDGIKASMATRASANKMLKGMDEFLSGEPMYEKWEENEKKYAKKIDVSKLSTELDEAGKASDKYINAEVGLKNLQAQFDKVQADIARLEKEKAELEDRIVKGKKYLADNKNAKKNYDEVKEQYDQSAKEISNYHKWQTIKQKKADRDEAETISQKADNQAKDLQQKIKELQADILPDLKGVELVTETGTEDGETRQEGLYWNGRNVAQLSESELWSLVINIWRKFKVRIVVIDNYQSLGTMAVKVLENLVKEGAQILTSEMKRGVASLEISYE